MCEQTLRSVDNKDRGRKVGGEGGVGMRGKESPGGDIPAD